MKTRSALKCLLVLFLFAGMGCKETIQDPTFTIGKEANFRINQLYTSSDGRCTLLINEISDSRCPEGVECFWQGEVSLKGEWSVNKSKTSIELHSVITNMEKQPDGFTIRIVDARPYPKTGTEIKPENSVVTLLIQKN
jgi:hypothetical protein